ncbi:uncharacterized protein LOC128886291 [Hylaeus anthracinus]|uniref:uncharacterized protein LOC128886291 n=1 Tax=Hylaeus anthracinus TaxID=313031 RepID=UPI0023B8AB54|nr:uncharacterized protein LOC128886291 [Hylaeus anthracinus]
MSSANSVCSPMEVNLKLPKTEGSNKDKVCTLPYRELVGSLTYLSTATRPDIAHAANVLSQYNTCFGEVHWTAAKRVLRYLKETMDLGISYQRKNESLVGYADADWRGCQHDRRSHTGYAFILGGEAISWESWKQKTVALSSTEAEYMSLSEATKEAIYLRKLLTDFGLEELPVIKLFGDNQSALRLAEDPVFHNRTKHIDIRHHFVRDAVRNNLVTLEYAPSDRMAADVLTKALSGPKHGTTMFYKYNYTF